MPSPTRRPVRLAAILVAAALLSGTCAKNKKNASPTTTGAASVATTTTGGGRTSTTIVAIVFVQVRPVGNAGPILVDHNGHTLYTLTKKGKPVTCTGPCATAWPPVTVPAGTAPPVVPGAPKISVIVLPDGTHILAIAGAPLRTFAADRSAGQATGNGVNAFGGTWRVVPAAGGGATGGTTTIPK
ncbi:MAG: hypothetical protein JWN46_1272 [Acidimicrobiales bacterium]|nr:hypothetical protein [Acidimicrobiales bacterium]